MLAIGFVGVVSIARLTRLWTQDAWPPMVKVRTWWITVTADKGWHGWEDLVTCPFCAAPWITLVIGSWGWFTGFAWPWWAFNIWMAASYLAPMLVVRDGE